MSGAARPKMRAAVMRNKALVVDEVPVPEPGPGEVLVEVAAASLNFGDIARCRGTVASVMGQVPFTIGMDVCGNVTGAVGSVAASGPARPSASALAPTESVSSGGGVTVIFDGHQFHRPSSTTVQGTSTVRTTNVSMMTPTARPTPTFTICDPPELRAPTTANTANVPASTRPAEVTVVPVTPSARATASRSGMRCASSLIRVITRML